jgi:hypothetical protein
LTVSVSSSLAYWPTWPWRQPEKAPAIAGANPSAMQAFINAVKTEQALASG